MPNSTSSCQVSPDAHEERPRLQETCPVANFIDQDIWGSQEILDDRTGWTKAYLTGPICQSPLTPELSEF